MAENLTVDLPRMVIFHSSTLVYQRLRYNQFILESHTTSPNPSIPISSGKTLDSTQRYQLLVLRVFTDWSTRIGRNVETSVPSVWTADFRGKPLVLCRNLRKVLKCLKGSKYRKCMINMITWYMLSCRTTEHVSGCFRCRIKSMKETLITCRIAVHTYDIPSLTHMTSARAQEYIFELLPTQTIAMNWITRILLHIHMHSKYVRYCPECHLQNMNVCMAMCIDT